MYRDITVVNPPGSILNADFPDAVGMRAVAPRRLFDAITGALAEAAPGMMPAASGGVSVTISLAELAADGFSRVIEVIQPMRCGMGAFQGRDGVDARDNSLNNMRNHPTETVEAQSSVRVLEYDIRPDSGGAGQWRGGVGQTITLEVLCDGGIFLARGLDRMRFAAFGVMGGQPGATLRIMHNRGRNDERVLGKVHELHVRRGDTITVLMPGGGGSGPPMRRDPDAVIADVIRGVVSAENAEREYGVVIRDDAIDREATSRMRAARAGDAEPERFTFGPDRQAWEAVFDDHVMRAVTRHLMSLPKAVRQDARLRLFEAAVPGIGAVDRPPLVTLMADPAAIARRLEAALPGPGSAA